MKTLSVICASAAMFLSACAPRVYDWPPIAAAIHAHEVDGSSARSLPMFAGHDGRAIAWSDLIAAMDWADVIIVGEQHDDDIGHAVELAIVEDVLDRWPRSAVSMEMLERDAQPLVEDYFDGIIDATTFARLARVQNWGGQGKWAEWFQPIVDAAKERNARVIAANPPRRYVRIARVDGYGRLRALPRDRRALLDVPLTPLRGDYHQRFAEVMARMAEAHAQPKSDDENANGEGEAVEPAIEEDAEHPPVDPHQFDAGFRSQMLWDATMAASIARARPSRSAKVVHIVGQFHSDFEGGTVLELRRRLPLARILTISMQRAEPDALREEDIGRADVIIYTGERPVEEPEEEEEEEEEPAGRLDTIASEGEDSPPASAGDH